MQGANMQKQHCALLASSTPSVRALLVSFQQHLNFACSCVNVGMVCRQMCLSRRCLACRKLRHAQSTAAGDVLWYASPACCLLLPAVGLRGLHVPLHSAMLTAEQPPGSWGSS